MTNKELFEENRNHRARIIELEAYIRGAREAHRRNEKLFAENEKLKKETAGLKDRLEYKEVGPTINYLNRYEKTSKRIKDKKKKKKVNG